MTAGGVGIQCNDGMRYSRVLAGNQDYRVYTQGGGFTAVNGLYGELTVPNIAMLTFSIRWMSQQSTMTILVFWKVVKLRPTSVSRWIFVLRGCSHKSNVRVWSTSAQQRDGFAGGCVLIQATHIWCPHGRYWCQPVRMAAASWHVWTRAVQHPIRFCTPRRCEFPTL